ncbi:hypothetical protein [Sphingomonas sp. VNH70]|uniref:hypothetical protein n=1 Tax=Sphingomonas silueang TaxID=3156617 RepID=UPI0032B3364F
MALLMLGVAIPGGPLRAAAPDDDALLLVVAADRLREEARVAGDDGAGALLLAALTLTARAEGRVHAPGGLPADLGYQPLWAETERAVRGDARLQAALARLPAPERGAGWRQQTRSLLPGGTWRERITYAGGEVAIIYARGTGARLRVDDPTGRTLCAPASTALCIWHPSRPQTVTVTVRATGNTPATFELLTN